MRIAHPQVREVSFEELRGFICEGKRNGWASGKKPIDFLNGSKGYKYVKGDLFYRDEYIGNGNFIGQEVVYFIRGLPDGNIPLWGMQYSDTFSLPADFPKDEIDPFRKEVMTFLKDCLMQVPEDVPFRGPTEELTKKVENRILTYFNFPKGTFKKREDWFREFKGHEAIRVAEPHGRGAREYNAFDFIYHGRLLVPDSYVKE